MNEDPKCKYKVLIVGKNYVRVYINGDPLSNFIKQISTENSRSKVCMRVLK